MNVIRENLGLVLFAASISAVEAVRSTLRDHHFTDNTLEESYTTDHASDDEVITVSAPGKVLLAGGYLVLEKENMGITVAGTSRFYTSIRLAPRKYVSSSFTISVQSPQFNESYMYAYNPVDGKVVELPGEQSNTFVLKALQVVFSFLSAHFGEHVFADRIARMHSEGILELKLRADNDFYSQTENVSLSINLFLLSFFLSIFISSLLCLRAIFIALTIIFYVFIAATAEPLRDRCLAAPAPALLALSHRYCLWFSLFVYVYMIICIFSLSMTQWMVRFKWLRRDWGRLRH